MNKYDFSRVHFYKYKDKNILIDINSDSIHLIDDLTFDVLTELKKFKGENEKDLLPLLKEKYFYQTQEVEEVIKEISELTDEGILFSSALGIENYQPPEDPIIKAMCLHIAHDCNMRCPYCFADQGPYGGDRGLMSVETGQKALEFLFKESKNRKNLNIDFFGGEPLMNFEVVKELMVYIEKRCEELDKIPELTLTTNALLLDKEKGDFLKEHNVSVVVSLDGRPEVQDSMRYTANKKGTYEVVAKNIQNFIKDGYEKYIVRGTFTRGNMDFLKDLKHLSGLGLKNLSIEPVVGPEEAFYSIKDEDIPRLLEEYDKLTDHMEENNDFNFFHFNIDIYKGPCLPKRISACGAGHEYVAISPQGDVYPCHQFVGNKDYMMGNVYEGEISKEIGKKFQNANVLNKEECMDCWARFYCSGGCHASNWHDTGDFYKVYKKGCALQKKRVECAIYLSCIESES